MQSLDNNDFVFFPTYFQRKTQKFSISRFLIEQSLIGMYFASFKAYYLRKTQNFSLSRFFQEVAA